MQSSWIPEHICDRLDKLNRDFLWSNVVTQRKTHLVSWNQVIKPKAEGGLGFREARLNNKAMLSKTVWKTARNEKTIWMELIKAKYLKGQSILHYSSKLGDSPGWKGVIKCAQELRSNFRWRVGDGSLIRFFLDIWFKGHEISSIISAIDQRDLKTRLNQVLLEDGSWVFSRLHTTIPTDVIQELQSSNIQLSSESDKLLWNGTASGLFTCQSAYKVLHQFSISNDLRQRPDFKWKVLWKSKLPNKFKYFLWLAVQDRLLTNELRYKRNMAPNPYCGICQETNENVLHILRHCTAAKEIWRSILPHSELARLISLPDATWFEENLLSQFDHTLNLNARWPAIFMAVIWSLWKSRNLRIFKGKADSKSRLIFLIKQLGCELQMKLEPMAYKQHYTWSKPPDTWAKLNVDGSCRPMENLGAIGCVLRDDKGAWMWGFSSKLIAPTINETELGSLVKGLELAWERRIPKLIVELDSEIVFGWASHLDHPPDELIPLVDCCKELLHMPW
ncbi:hypothetical protein OROMI_024724 [Orobanche minor]